MGILTLVVLSHEVYGVAQVLVAHGVVVAAEFCYHGFEVVLLEPGRYVGHILWKRLVARDVLTAEVVVEVLLHM